MAGETIITVIGNLTGDPELRFTPSGAAVANFTVASTPRTFDRQSSEWKDGETLFMRCSVWREAAENVAESLHRGTRVIVTGRLKSRSWDDKETGQKRTVIEMDVDEVAPSLRYATTKITKTQRGGGGGSFGGGGSQEDPWGGGSGGSGPQGSG
ncbi:MAG: single-stranded DNA-binding protein, partial [Nostocoides sp.]